MYSEMNNIQCSIEIPTDKMTIVRYCLFVAREEEKNAAVITSLLLSCNFPIKIRNWSKVLRWLMWCDKYWWILTCGHFLLCFHQLPHSRESCFCCTPQDQECAHHLVTVFFCRTILEFSLSFAFTFACIFLLSFACSFRFHFDMPWFFLLPLTVYA